MRNLTTLICTPGLGKYEVADFTTTHPVMTVLEAMKTVWEGDYYFSAYHEEPLSGEPSSLGFRLNKEHASYLSSQGRDLRFSFRVGDLDTTGKRKLTDSEKRRILMVLKEYDCCFYFTSHGARVLQPLTRDLGPEEFEVCLEKWWRELDVLINVIGIPDFKVDRSCKNWNRLYRLPKVIRNDKGTKTNQQDTKVVNHNCPAVDPGDCTPPPVTVQRRGVRVESWGTTGLGKWALNKFGEELASAPEGAGTDTLSSIAFTIGMYAGAGQIEDGDAVSCIQDALSRRGVDPDAYEHTLFRCYESGKNNPVEIENNPEWGQESVWKNSPIPVDETGDLTFESPETKSSTELSEAEKLELLKAGKKEYGFTNIELEVFEEDGKTWAAAFVSDWQAFMEVPDTTRIGWHTAHVLIKGQNITRCHIVTEEANG